MTWTRVAVVAAVIAPAAAWWLGAAQPATDDRQARFAKMSADAESRGLAEPFTGVTTDGTPQAGLFRIGSTGVTTEPVRLSATALLAALTPEQRAKTTFAVDDPEWRKWMNQHFYVRRAWASPR